MGPHRRASRDPLRAGVALPGLALAAAGSAVAGFAAGLSWLLPILNAAPAHFAMIVCLRRGRRVAAVGLMLWWAACLGTSTTILTAADPWGTASRAVINGPAYLAAMRTWVETGAGCESDPSCFIPQHAMHAAAFALLALATAGAAAILMGAILMNYMAYYVGSIAAGSASPILTAAAAWHPWSLVRIASFVVLGVLLAEPLLSRITRRSMPPGRGRWIAWAVCGLAADVILKALLAPSWPGILRSTLG